MDSGLGCTLRPALLGLVGFQESQSSVLLVSFISNPLLPMCGSLKSSKEVAQGPDVLITAMLAGL